MGTFWESDVDATSGGALADPPSYVYARFTPTGLQQQTLQDVQALGSMDWDIAFRRSVVRLNSGDSGPSCVAAVTLPMGTTFDSITSVPGGLLWATEDIMTPTCTLIENGSGLPGQPDTQLDGYWTYTGCVAMTHRVFLVRLANGSTVKLEVLRYYNAAAQLQCDAMGTLPAGDPGSAHILMRWALLP